MNHSQKSAMELLQIGTAFLLKVRYGLLQIATGITKCDDYNMQIATEQL